MIEVFLAIWLIWLPLLFWTQRKERDMITKADLICTGCNRRPDEIEEYISYGVAEAMDPAAYVMEEEGTLNPANGHFLCTACYIRAGMPTAPHGWVAP